MLHDLGDCDALRYILCEHLCNKVCSAGVDVLRHVVLAILDLVKEMRQVIMIEGKSTSEEGVENDPAGPDIGRSAVIVAAHHDLRSSVVRAAAGGAEEVRLSLPGSHSEVNNLDVLVVVEEQVLGLQVSVTDALSVYVILARVALESSWRH